MTTQQQEKISFNDQKRMQQSLDEIALNAPLQAKENLEPALEDGGAILPRGFLMLEADDILEVKTKEGGSFLYEAPAGLYYEHVKLSKRTMPTEDGSEETEKEGFYPLRICPAFQVIAETNNLKGNDRSLILGWKNNRGKPQRIEVRAGDIHKQSNKSELYRTMTQAGLTVPASSDRARREAFEKAILGIGVHKKQIRTDKIGWNEINGQSVYALPIGTCFPKNKNLYSPDKMSEIEAYKCKGTLEGWKENLAFYAEKNRLLALGICLSFAGSLLELANMEGGAFNLVGSSQTGKSTALKAAASVWGNPERGAQIQSWRTTDNQLENIAMLFNDGILFLDEMKECAPKHLSNVAYMLANGCGKGRMNKDGTPKELKTWRILFFSNGETHLKDLITANGGTSYAGQDVRITDLSAQSGKHGIFNELYHFEDGGEMAESLTDAFSNHYGLAGIEWLKCLTAQDLKALKAEIQKEIREFVKEARPEGIPIGQITSVLKRFALCAVAGELAIRWNILPWQVGTAQRLMKENIACWLKERGTASGEEKRIIETLQAILSTQEARFQNGDSEEVPQNRLGWKQWDGGLGITLFHIPQTSLKDIFKEFDLELVKEILFKKQILESKETAQKRLGNARPRVFTLNPEFLHEE